MIKGWTPGAVRRHTTWLKRVNAPANAAGHKGYAVTLTMRDCPPDAETFHALREAWIKRVRRAGAVRVHWVVEWQRRGVPHLHTAIYWPEDHENVSLAPALAISSWTAVAEPYGARIPGQYYDEIYGAEGWLQYLSKHAARGVQHYQRNGHPKGWNRTGRLWGYTGKWEMDEPLVLEVDYPTYWRYRRLVRSWRVADARSERDASKRPMRIAYARRMLSCPMERLSRVRGVSEWVPEHISDRLVAMLAAEGHEFTPR